MKVLLVSQVPTFFEQFRQGGEFAPFQAQTFWVKAIRKLASQVEVFRYSDPPVISVELNCRLVTWLEQKSPRLYRRYRLLKNRYPWLFWDNYIKSLILSIKMLRLKPQVIVISGGVSELVGLELVVAKALGARIALLHGVNPREAATGYESCFVSQFDLVVTNAKSHAKGWLQLGAPEAISLPYSGIDRQYHRPQAVGKDISVVFAGTLFPERIRFLSKLVELGVDVHVVGYIPNNLTLPKMLKARYHGGVWGKELLKIYSRAQIVINPLPDHMPDGANLRMFEIPACGSLQLTSYCDPSWFKIGKEIIVYDSLSDLVTKIKHYLNHPRQRASIAKAGLVRVQQYTYHRRFRDIFDRLKVSDNNDY